MAMTNSYPRLLVLCVTALLAGTGCGFDNVTEGEASEGWRTASRPLLEGQRAIQAKAQEQTDQLIAGETITEVVDCEEAGEVKFALSVDLPEEGEMANEPEVDLTAGYRDCEADRIEVDGDLTIDSDQFAQLRPGDGEDDEECDCPTPTNVSYIGDLDYAGKVDGPCNVDLDAEIPPWGQPTYSGEMCGYDAADVLGGF